MFSHTILLDDALGLDSYDENTWTVLPANVVRQHAQPTPSFDESFSKRQFEEACKDLDNLGDHMVIVETVGIVVGQWRIRPFTLSPSDYYAMLGARRRRLEEFAL